MKIFEANKPMLSNPDKIYPGQKLRIPPKRRSRRSPGWRSRRARCRRGSTTTRRAWARRFPTTRSSRSRRCC
jgi:hypothetical protein